MTIVNLIIYPMIVAGITAYIVAAVATRTILRRRPDNTGTPGLQGPQGIPGPQGEPGPAITCACPATEHTPQHR